MDTDMPKKNTQSGFSLVESLVALLILSIGLLGIAALYVDSIGAGRTALLRSQAVALASDMADRIRANANALAAYDTVLAGGGADNGCVAGVLDCTPAQMASHDVFIWLQAIAARLPNGQGVVVFNGGLLPPLYTITVSWTEVGEPAPVQFQLRMQI